MSKVDPLKGGMAVPVPIRPPQRRSQRQTDSHSGETSAAIPAHVLPLIEEITAGGQALAHDPTGEHLERYKSAVRSFLETALHDSMRVQAEASLGLSQKVFSTITRVDVALAELTDAILGRQQDVLKLREIVDQIKGLIIDLYR